MPRGKVIQINLGRATISWDGGFTDAEIDDFADPVLCGELQENDHGALKVGDVVEFDIHDGGVTNVRRWQPPVAVQRQESPVLLPAVNLQTGTGACPLEADDAMQEVIADDDEHQAPSDQPDTCCDKVGSLIPLLDATRPLGVMLRETFDRAWDKLGYLKRGNKTPERIAFDISFLWDSGSLSLCNEKVDISIILSFGSKWAERPKTNSVASCHPTAQTLTTLLGTDPLGPQVGQLGPVQSQSTDMSVHRETCRQLCLSLDTTPRGIWWVSHCGHSFCLIKRECVPDIEIIDSFANDRGIGLWALTPSEVTGGSFEVHTPPAKRIWSLGELKAQLMLIVDDDQGKRWDAQLALVNYDFEMPEDKGPNDRLPYGPFGFRGFGLIPDDEILVKVVQKLYHAYANWKPHAK